MMKRMVCALTAVLGLHPLADAQVRPIYDTGAAALARQLERLQTTASVLHTGAHPDDEDSALIAWHARGENARTAYLSLTRGAGGQNLIGPEQSALLGVIRTEELLQARRLDGAHQLFTRAIDYGFSKHRAEAARVWDEDVVLGDMVRALRLFRPDVVVSRWDGTPADGHGHHQFAGYLTPLAVAAAADAARFPEQLAEGLRPWRVKKTYVVARSLFDGGTVLDIDTGEYDPVAGRSYFEIGMHGRSQQRTQSMGQIEFRGRQISRLRRLDGSDARESSVFDGLDTSVAGIAEHESVSRRDFQRRLRALQASVEQALEDYNALAPHEVVPRLAEALSLARDAHAAARDDDTKRLLDEKIEELELALALAAGVVVDALASAETVVPGGELQLAVRVYHPGHVDLAVTDANLSVPPGWRVGPGNRLDNEAGYRRRDTAAYERLFEARVPDDASPTAPYWLAKPAVGAHYDWSGAGGARTLPFEEERLSAVVTLAISGQPVTLKQPFVNRFLDRVRGELRRRVDVVPAATVAPAADLLVVSASAENRRQTVPLTVSNQTSERLRGTLQVEAPAGWTTALATNLIDIPPRPASITVPLEIEVPQDASAGRYSVSPVVTVGETQYRDAMDVVAYAHVHTHRVYEPGEITIELVDVRVAPVTVGYVMGSGDLVPSALRNLGVDVVVLDDEYLQNGDLDQFDTILVGIRASQARPAFVANNQRLLDFARAGGTLIVQYQQPDYIEKGLAPFDAQMERSVRVVDETAAVEILEPGHPVFTFPNAIVDTDFDDWVQERNNYNFTSYDASKYLPLTESHDPGEPPSTGAMLHAELGSGRFVYTSYSWFRQLPNGVPGAYRLFANLISLPMAPETNDE